MTRDEIKAELAAFTAEKIIKARNDGMLSDHETHAELDKIQVRGVFAGLDFVGYDYRNQRWIHDNK